MISKDELIPEVKSISASPLYLYSTTQELTFEIYFVQNKCISNKRINEVIFLGNRSSLEAIIMLHLQGYFKVYYSRFKWVLFVCLFVCLFVFKGKKGKRKTTLVRAFMYFKWNVSFLIFLHYSETTQNEFVGIGYFLICNTYWIDIWHAFIVINFICEICRFHFPWLFLVFNLVPWALGHYESFSFKVKVCVNCHLKTKLNWLGILKLISITHT